MFLKDSELRALAPTLRGVPVKCEHAGIAVGRIASAFVDEDGRLNTIMKLDESSFAGRMASSFVSNGTAGELSLGYTVDVKQSLTSCEKVEAQEKKVLEVSLVKKGARDNCNILAMEKHGLFLRSAGQENATEGVEKKQTETCSQAGFDYFD